VKSAIATVSPPICPRQLALLLVRTLQKFVQKAQFVHDFKCRRMDGIAAEITEKVGVLLQHHNIHAGPGQEKTQHHASRTTAGDTTTRPQDLVHRAIVNRSEISEDRELETRSCSEFKHGC
jgi:hypothetical protein